MSRKVFFWLIILAAVIRVFFIFNPGFEADVSFWKSWGLATYDKGMIEGIKVSNNNYPAPFSYVLGLMVLLYSFVADPHNYHAFWTNTNPVFLFFSKIFPILADFGIAGIFIYIGRHAEKLGFPQLEIRRLSFWQASRRARPESQIDAGQASMTKTTSSRANYYDLAALIYLFSPLSIIDGAWWGQVDAMGVVIFLVSLLFTLQKKPFLGGLFFMVAMMTKLQNMIYGPVYFLFIWQLVGFNGLVKAIIGAVVGFAGLNIEFILARYTDRVFASLFENYDYFPWMSLNAYNLWWIVSGAKGMQVSDKLLSIGIVPAKTVGLLLFSGMYLFAVLKQFINSLWVADTRDPIGTHSSANLNVPTRKNGTDHLPTKDQEDEKISGRTRIAGWDTRQTGPMLKTFIESLIIVNAAFFLFQTQSHDRYAFPLSAFLLLWGAFIKPKKLFFIFYFIFSLFYFYNLHTGLVINYPHNGLPLLSSLTQPFFTITTSYLLMGLFLVFLTYLVISSKISRSVMSVVFVIFVLGLAMLNKPLLTKQPVPLVKYVPWVSEQGYGTRQTNKTVQSTYNGPGGWTRLSVQYYFYKKGIGTHANSKHVYNLNGKFSRFTTDYGIDTESGDKGSAIFEIWGDQKLLFRSEKMGRYDNPRHAEVDLKGIKNITLITSDAGDGAYDDHTDWLNPQLWP